MARRPQSLRYANGERPPLALLLSLAAQHATFAAIYLAPAVVVAKASSFTPEQQAMFLTGTIFCCGIAALLQAGSKRIGSGLLIMPIASPMFIGLLIEAGSQGGPGAISTAVLLIALIQLVMGPLIHRSRAFFPPEVCGVVTAMIGLTLVQTAMSQIPEINPFFGSGKPATADQFVAFITLTTIAASTVWLKGYWRSFAMLLGCAVGYGAAHVLGGLAKDATTSVAAAMFTLPHLSLPGFNVGLGLVPSLVLLGIVSTVYAMGILISTDRLDDADWQRPDIAQVSRGVMGMGIGNLFSALLGGTAIGMTALSTALSFSSGVTSRVVGIAAGLLLLVLSLLASSTTFLMMLPPGVLAGLLGYVAIYLVASGFQLALSRMMSPRRLLVIGIPVCAGVYAASFPTHSLEGAGIAAAIRESPLALTTFLAITVNMLMRLGIAQQESWDVAAGTPHPVIVRHFEELGERWGLRRATVTQAADISGQVLEAVGPHAASPVTVTTRHDEVNLDLAFRYEGPATADLHRPLADWIVSQLSEPIRTTEDNGRTIMRLRLAT